MDYYNRQEYHVHIKHKSVKALLKIPAGVEVQVKSASWPYAHQLRALKFLRDLGYYKRRGRSMFVRTAKQLDDPNAEAIQQYNKKTNNMII